MNQEIHRPKKIGIEAKSPLNQEWSLTGMFSAFKDRLRKSEAAVVVQNLLERHERNFGLSAPPAALANKLVDHTWNSSPELFNGKKSGARAHKVSIAAYALACAAYGANKKGTNEEMELAFAMSLGKVLEKVQSSPQEFRFTDIDGRLLSKAQEIFEQLANDPKYREQGF
jgi:hypothetical protein